MKLPKEQTDIDSTKGNVEMDSTVRYSREEIMLVDTTVNTSWTCINTIAAVNNNLL
jgi:hypothetical protein